MLPQEPSLPSSHRPPARTCSAQLRECRALAPPRRTKSTDSLLPFEPLRRPPPKRTNSASERCKRALAVVSTTTSTKDDAVPLDPSPETPLSVTHELFQSQKYEQALAYYRDLLTTRSSDLNAATYIEIATNAAKCCYHLHQYVDEESMCQLVLERLAQEQELDSSLADAMIQCTLLRAKALGRQRKTLESVQVLRDCRELIHKYTCYKSVKEYMSEHHVDVDQVGFVGGSHAKVAVIVPGV